MLVASREWGNEKQNGTYFIYASIHTYDWGLGRGLPQGSTPLCPTNNHQVDDTSGNHALLFRVYCRFILLKNQMGIEREKELEAWIM